MRRSSSILLARSLLIAAAFAPGVVCAQTFPTRQITIVVPLAAGTGMDTLARSYGDALQKALGKPVVVENQTGASTMLATTNVRNSKSDGHTLLVATGGAMAINPVLYKKVNYDPGNDFVPIALYAKSPSVLLVHPSVPVKSLRELIEYVKVSNPTLEYSSPGIGSPHHLTMELLKKHFDMDLVHVPYRSSTQAMIDMIAGHVKIGFGEVAASLPLVQAGQLRALAVSTPQRLPSMPDTPTIAEAAGLPGFETVSWHMMFAPRGTPAATVEILHREMLRITSSPLLQGQIADLGLVPVVTPPVAELRDYLAAEQKKWGDVVRALGLARSQ
jgi:tripartite-type tricarboxylate transporter receptor subunit TctC